MTIPWVFETFWAVWPEKRGEAAAKRAFMFLEADCRPKGITFDQILESAARYAKNPGTSRYMAASKWLSEHRFLDADPVIPPAAAQPSTKKRSGLAALRENLRSDDDASNGHGSGLPDLASKHDGPTLDLTARDISEQTDLGRRRVLKK